MAEERRPAIDREELFQAANDLVADGKRVTATALLDALGGGSLRTIYKYLEEWKAGQAQEPSNNGQTELPDAVLAAFKATWRTATAEAERATAAVREQAAEEVKAAEAKFTDALEAIERLETRADQDTQKIEGLTARIADLEASLRNAETEKAALVKDADTAQALARSADEKAEKNQEKAEKAIAEAAELRGKVEALTTQNRELLSHLQGSEQEKPKRK